MRTKTAQQSAIIGNPSHSALPLITLYASDGTTTWGADAFALAVELEEDLDSPRTARVTLRRQMGKRSLAPLVTPTALNPFAGEAVVAVGRRVKVSVAVTPADVALTSTAIEVFDGYVDEVSWAKESVELSCTDRRARLRDTWIERERVYGLAQGVYATKGAYVWSSTLAPLALGDLVVPSDAKKNTHFYRVTTVVGPQNTGEPVWPTGSGATVASGGVTFTESGLTNLTTGLAVESLIQQILNDNGLGSFATLQTPVSPSWMVKPFLQDRSSVWDACARLADQIGWSLRFQWSASLGRFELHLTQPDRSATTPNRTFTADEERDLTEVGVAIFDIRNAVQVTYADSSARSSAGIAPRRIVQVVDTASVTKYGRRFLEVQEADTSNLDTNTEASRMANAILADLKDPLVSVAYQCACDPFLEVNDLVQLPADGLRWSSAQTLAVQGYTHSITSSEASTTLKLRGKPASRLRRWAGIDVRKNMEDRHRLSLSSAGDVEITAAPNVGGARISIKQALLADALTKNYEVHVSETSGFIPSETTMRIASAATRADLTDLTPGTTYYARLIPYSTNGARFVYGEPSAEVSFVAGRASTAHLEDLAVTTAKLGDLAVSTGKIADGAVLAAKIPNREISTIKIATSAVTSGELADNAVTTAKLIDSAVFGTKIMDSGVLALKLDAGAPLSPWDHERSPALSPRITSVINGTKTTPVEYGSQLVTITPTTGTTDCYFETNIQFRAFRGTIVQMTYRLRGGAAWKSGDIFRLYNIAAVGENTTAQMINDGGWHTATFDVSSWSNTGTLRVDLQDSGIAIGAGAAIDIAYLGFGFLGAGGQNLMLSHVRAKTATAGSYATNATIIYGTEEWDTLNEYDPTTGIFTATVAGKYQISAAIFCGNLAYALGNSVTVVANHTNSAGTGLNFAYGYRAFAPSAANWYLTSSVVTTFNLSAGDKIKAYVSHDRAGGNVSLFGDASGNYIAIDRLV